MMDWSSTVMTFQRFGLAQRAGVIGGVMTGVLPLDARVPLLERGEVLPEVALLYDSLYAERGVVPNMFKALAVVPGIAMGVTAFLKPLMAEGVLRGWYKELVATRIASLNRCEYCMSAHSYLALKRGATLGQVASYNDFEFGPFTAKEKAGFRYASLLHQSGHAINKAAFDEVSEHFCAEEIIELTTVAAAFEMFSRINSALRIPVTPLQDSPFAK